MNVLTTPATNGGARPGSGRKGAAIEAAVKARVDAEGDYLDYAVAKAQKETYQARMAELDFNVKSGKFVSRDSVRAACAAAFAAIAQTLRSIPDNLERRVGVSPEVAQEVGNLIDDSMDELSLELERMSNDGF